MSNRWIVHTKGAAGRNFFEIAVIRADNVHGMNSYGWFGPDKLLISHNGGPCKDSVTQEVWKELIAVADLIAASMNATEQKEKQG